MATALLLAAATLLVVVSVSLSLSYLRRVNSITTVDARALAASLKRLPADARLAELERRAPEGWERQLAADLIAAPGESERLAITNDALADVAHRLEEAAGWPSSALRISALGALLIAAIAFLGGRTDAILPVLGIGAAGVLAAVEIGRRARTQAARQREALDALIEVAVVLDETPSPARGSWSRRAKRGRRPR